MLRSYIYKYINSLGSSVCVFVLHVSAVYLLLDAFSRPARKNTTDQNLLRQNFIAYIFRSQSARSKRERKTKPRPY